MIKMVATTDNGGLFLLGAGEARENRPQSYSSLG